jgi:uncharacterized membrane protein
MDKVLLALIFVIFLWSFMFIFYKKLTNKVDYETLLIIKIICVSLTGLLGVFLYLIFNKKKRLKIIRTDKKLVNFIFITALLELLTTFLYIYLLYKKDANWLIAVLEAGIIILTLFLSIILLKEKINMDRVLGLIILVVGMLIVYRS